jgi:drug/metabolite transporter (DMT)-like permease
MGIEHLFSSASFARSTAMTRPLAVVCLVITTVIWGSAFVAQKYGTYSMGPLTFTSARYLLGGICVLPLALWEYRRGQGKLSARHGALVLLLISVFFVGTWLQQAGLITASVTNGGFLTGLYVFFVPLVLFFGFGQKPHPVLWVCVPLVLCGLYLLNGGITRLKTGDMLLVACAACWACHILLLGFLSRATGLPIVVSAAAFVGAGLLATGGAFVLEKPHLSALAQGWIAIAYTGILSTAVAFSLQAIGQRHVPSSNAAIILSGESLFACLGGAILLHERLPPAGYVGAALIFIAIILIEGVPAFAGPRAKAAGPKQVCSATMRMRT